MNSNNNIRIAWYLANKRLETCARRDIWRLARARLGDVCTSKYMVFREHAWGRDSMDICGTWRRTRLETCAHRNTWRWANRTRLGEVYTSEYIVLGDHAGAREHIDICGTCRNTRLETCARRDIWRLARAGLGDVCKLKCIVFA